MENLNASPIHPRIHFFSHSVCLGRLALASTIFLMACSLSACRGSGGASTTGTSSSSGGSIFGGGGTDSGGGSGGGSSSSSSSGSTGGTTGGTTSGTTGSTSSSGVNPGSNFTGRPPLPPPDPSLTNQLSATLSVATPSTTSTLRASAALTGRMNDKKAVTLNLTTKNISAFQILTETGGLDLATYTLQSPSGKAVISSLVTDAPEKTTAVDLANDVNALPYPAIGLDFPGLGQDQKVVDGKYVHLLYINGGVGTQYSQRAFGKNDPNLAIGLLRVNVFFVGTTAQRADYRDAVQRAIAIWKEIYAQVGVNLDVRLFDIPSGTGVIPNPFVGSSFYSSILTGTAGLHELALNLFIGASISQDATTNPGNLFDEGVFGVSPAIPGPAGITIKTAVAISINNHAGRDSVFTGDEIEVLGETFAHEGGHFLGLFHPVQDNPRTPGNYFESDPLSDTGVCATDQACIASGLATNLMFPVTEPGIPQQRGLTGLQGQTINNQVIVD